MSLEPSPRWEITFPDGRVERVTNLSEFCRQHGCNQGNLFACGYSKGFKARRYGARGVHRCSPETRRKIGLAVSAQWEVTFPDGHREIIRNLSAFCRTHDCYQTNLSRKGYSKGYRAKRL
jgi:phage-related protein